MGGFKVMCVLEYKIAVREYTPGKSSPHGRYVEDYIQQLSGRFQGIAKHLPVTWL